MNNIIFAHTNILARDWQSLSQFYIDTFGCKPIFPERNMKGKWIDDMTNIEGVHIKGIHLAMPGFKNNTPTLEIFSYSHPLDKKRKSQINEIGFTHIAFRVDNVKEYVDRVLKNGGSFYGKIIEKEIEDVGHLTAVYMRDPEGNIVEIQSWNN